MPDAPTDPDNLLSELLPPFWALFQPEPSEADRAVIGPDYLSYLDDETDGTAREYARRIGAGNAASYAVVLRAGARKAGPA